MFSSKNFAHLSAIFIQLVSKGRSVTIVAIVTLSYTKPALKSHIDYGDSLAFVVVVVTDAISVAAAVIFVVVNSD